MATKSKARKDSLKTPRDDTELNKTSNKRGRPRVESQDQNAVERRRTQIRLAQRAYRERKETTISVLEAQVGHLRHVIREMTTAVSDFNDKTLASGLPDMQPSLAEDLSLVVEQVNELYRRSGVEDEEESATFSVPSANSRQSSISQPKPSTPPTPPAYAIHTSHYREPLMVDSRYSIDDTSMDMLGYTLDLGSSPNATPISDTPMNQLHTWTEAWNMSQPASAYNECTDKLLHSPRSPGSWVLNIPAELKSTESYSWRETSFARRLLRHSHERCLDVLTNPNAKVDPTNNRVRYSLSFMSKDELTAKVRRTMSKTTSEPLEDWTMPMLHVGGAGLHFDRDSSELTPPSGFTAERNTGPFQLPSAAIKVPPIYFPDKVAKWLGLSGTWFDNRDVEVYLKNKGVNVDGGSMTTVVEIEDETELETPSSIESLNQENGTTGVLIPGVGRVVTPQDEIMFNEFDKLINAGASSRRRRVEVSLDKLVYELNEKCFCLGRAPGYKQSDVDEIYQRLIADAYVQSTAETMLLGSIAVP